jgi:RimJ/RimL family protein N-acetyltransferase
MIETDRLILRPWREADRVAFARIINTPAMMVDFGGVRTAEQIDRLFDKRVADQERHGHSFWAVELRKQAELIGSCGVRVAHDYPDTPVEGMRELGWRIAETHWRQGYAREAAQAAIAWSWANTDEQLLAAWTTPDNYRSWGVMERLGMTRRRDLDFVDRDGSSPHVELSVYTLERPS